jgi:hypothetical protein
VVRCSGRAIDGEVLEIIKRAVFDKSRLLDVGAGDLEVRNILQAQGFTGEYETLDVGTEFPYTYDSIVQVVEPVGAILLLDVLEHLPLRDGLALVQDCILRLPEGGVLVVQTPNGRCVRSPFTSDMTHVQSYNLPDLWAYLTALGCRCEGYRVAFQTPRRAYQRALDLVGQAVTTRLLGLDYADNILLVARKSALPADASARDASGRR